MTQTFQYIVPDSTLLWSTALPEVIEDPVIAALASELLGGGDAPVHKSAIEAWLRGLTAADVAAMDPPRRQAVWALSDVFACAIRFRARLRMASTVDVTRNLTVRHTRRLAGPNANVNAVVASYAVAEVHMEDADQWDLRDPDVTKTWYPFIEDGVRVADRIEVPRHTGHTYFLTVDVSPQQYTSPYDYAGLLSEEGSYRWYYYRQDQPNSDHRFFVDEDGGEAEMYMLDEEARIAPAGVGSTFRVVACVRDERNEWERYYAVPGTGVVEGVVVFVAP